MTLNTVCNQRIRVDLRFVAHTRCLQPTVNHRLWNCISDSHLLTANCLLQDVFPPTTAYCQFFSLLDAYCKLFSMLAAYCQYYFTLYCLLLESCLIEHLCPILPIVYMASCKKTHWLLIF